MSINKFNAEGYYDPTCYKALSKVEREEREVIDDLSDEKMQKRLWKEGSFEQGI